MSNELETLVIRNAETPIATMIWLHGLGADATDLKPMIEMMEFDIPIEFILPNAPIRNISINSGAKMRGWYNVEGMNTAAPSREILESIDKVSDIIEAQISSGIKSNQIALAGFSQGGTIAIEVALRFPKRLAAIIGLSTYIDDHEHLAQRIELANIDTPILLAHGVYDPMIHISKAITARETLSQLGYQVDWLEYPIGHQICEDEIETVNNWIADKLTK